MSFKRLKFKKINNARDLGGLPAADGKRIKYGKLIRSVRLYKLPASTVKRLKDYGLTAVIDLRTDNERREKPRTEIAGVKYYDVPILTTSAAAITGDKSMAQIIFSESKHLKEQYGTADNYMRAMYTDVLFNEASVPKLRKFFDVLLAEEGCVLWLCNQGKDRTGILAMLLESLLGVDEQLIISDYVASGRFLRHKRRLQKTAIFIVPCPLRIKLILNALINVKPRYITGAIDAIKEKYGSVTEYCKQVIKITDEEISALRNKYLE